MKYVVYMYLASVWCCLTKYCSLLRLLLNSARKGISTSHNRFELCCVIYTVCLITSCYLHVLSLCICAMLLYI